MDTGIDGDKVDNFCRSGIDTAIIDDDFCRLEYGTAIVDGVRLV